MSNIDWFLFALGVIIGVISSALWDLVKGSHKGLWGLLLRRKGLLCGTWRQQIYDERGNLVKRDTVRCHHRGDSVTGTITREEPSEQMRKKWRFQGKVSAKLFYCIFWT